MAPRTKQPPKKFREFIDYARKTERGDSRHHVQLFEQILNRLWADFANLDVKKEPKAPADPLKSLERALNKVVADVPHDDLIEQREKIANMLPPALHSILTTPALELVHKEVTSSKHFLQSQELDSANKSLDSALSALDELIHP